MIKVPRDDTLMPDALRTDTDSDGTIETADAIAYFQERAKRRATAAAAPPGVADISKKDKKFTFKVYGTAKSALKRMFHDKCGYCEIGYGGATREIEHYRPTGRIDYFDNGEKKRHSEGYYWLGAAWDNLILVCSHCNKLETHLHQEQAYAARVTRVSGKGNFFPLEDENARAKPMGSVEDERPLLLDPCRDNPSEHLDFRENGLVHPRLINGRPSKKGQESIKVYGLRRLELVEMRREIARRLLLDIDRLNKKIAKCSANPGAREARAELSDAFNQIRERYLTPDKPFLALCLTLYKRVDRDAINRLLGRTAGTTQRE